MIDPVLLPKDGKKLSLNDAEIHYYESFFSTTEAETLFKQLLNLHNNMGNFSVGFAKVSISFKVLFIRMLGHVLPSEIARNHILSSGIF